MTKTMSIQQANNVLSWILPNVCSGILFTIPVHDPATLLVVLGYIAKSLTFIGAMAVNGFAIRHYYKQDKKK